MSKIFVFGFGSILAPVGLAHRNLRRKYCPDDFTECRLSDYARSFNAVYESIGLDEDEEPYRIQSRFFGISPQSGARTNGVIFPLDKRDIDEFISSEGGERVYHFLNVRALLTGVPLGVLGAEDRVFACVTKRPSFDGRVSQGYLDRCANALRHRSPEFKREFGSLADYPGAPKTAISTV